MLVPFCRGTTFLEKVIAIFTDDVTSTPLRILAAELEIRRGCGDRELLLFFTTEAPDAVLTISGPGANILSMVEIDDEDTATWTVGSHTYRLAVTFEDFGKQYPMTGNFNVFE